MCVSGLCVQSTEHAQVCGPASESVRPTRKCGAGERGNEGASDSWRGGEQSLLGGLSEIHEREGGPE